MAGDTSEDGTQRGGAAGGWTHPQRIGHGAALVVERGGKGELTSAAAGRGRCAGGEERGAKWRTPDRREGIKLHRGAAGADRARAPRGCLLQQTWLPARCAARQIYADSIAVEYKPRKHGDKNPRRFWCASHPRLQELQPQRALMCFMCSSGAGAL